MKKYRINVLPTWPKQLGLGMLLLVGASGWVAQSIAGDKENVIGSDQAGGQQLSLERGQEPGSSAETNEKVVGSEAGFTAFIDPTTGRLVEPTDHQMSNMHDSKIESLRPNTGYEEPGLESGVMVDVRGQFDLEVHATISEDGTVEITHVPAQLDPETASHAVDAGEASKINPEGD